MCVAAYTDLMGSSYLSIYSRDRQGEERERKGGGKDGEMKRKKEKARKEKKGEQGRKGEERGGRK